MPNSLRLVHERKIEELFPINPPTGALEASGVLAMSGKFYVVFDNRTDVARLADNLIPNQMNGFFGMAHGRRGFECIAYNPFSRRYYLLIESRRTRRGEFRPEIFEYDESLAYLRHRKIDFLFDSESKGFEALAYIRRNRRDYVLALCEGNRCKSGPAGKRPGGGRIQLFKKKRIWSHVGTIKLPKSVRFNDYSAMTIDGSRVAVVSQENSMLWIGVFQEQSWNWRDEGETYLFPRNDGGEIHYGNVEGVYWITHSRIVAVSDRKKKNQAVCVAEKDQSIHIFDIPEKSHSTSVSAESDPAW